MVAAKRKAQVFYDQRLAGILVESNDGFEFTYDKSYLAGGAPIAFAYPLRETTFKHLLFPSFFENLMAEGWLRKLQSQEQRIDENDRFGLLLKNGRDLIGAVTIAPLTE